MDIANVELHDANLLSVWLDAEAAVMNVRVAYYATENVKERSIANIRFTGVSKVNQIADLDLLSEHAKFGNIAQLVAGERPGRTFIFLVRGLIEVTAASVEFSAEA